MITNIILRKRIEKYGLGVALGGGSVRGFFHLGVLKALEEKQIPISYIAGISIGSLIGGLYAYGYNSIELKKILQEESKLPNLLRQASPQLDFKKGLFSGETMIKSINALVHSTQIENFKIPFICQAADIYYFKEVVFTKGDLGLAIRASCSIPGIFSGVEFDGGQLFDGSILGSVPLKILKQHFRGPIFASNLISYHALDAIHAQLVVDAFNKELINKMFPLTEPLVRSYLFMQSHLTQQEYMQYPPDISIQFDGSYHPTITNILEYQERLVEDGYKVTVGSLEKIGY